MTATQKWVLAIAGLLLGNVIALVTLAVIANRGTSQVIPDYYARAASYDDELARSSASQALGWRVEVRLDGGAIEATARDANHQPLTGARVRVTGYQRAHAGQPLALELVAHAPGRYAAAAPVRAGRYDLVVAIDRGAAHYTQHVALEAR